MTTLVEALQIEIGFTALHDRNHDFLEVNGWIPLGERADDSKFCWTTLELGLQGAVSTEEALQIEREKRTK